MTATDTVTIELTRADAEAYADVLAEQGALALKYAADDDAEAIGVVFTDLATKIGAAL